VNTDRHVGSWVGAGVLTVLTLALLIPSGWLAVGSLANVSDADHLAGWHTVVLMACCPVIGALLMRLAGQLSRDPVPAAHQVLIMVAGTFFAAELLTLGEVVSYLSQGSLFVSAGW
jgi:hypothetical protein